MEIIPTKKKDGLIINFSNDEGVYLYDRIKLISYGGRGNDNFSKRLSTFFENNNKCKLIKKWERELYDIDPYGNNVYFGGIEIREIWDLKDWFNSYNVIPTDNSNSYSIIEFENNM